MADYKKMAQQILDNIGSKDNISNMTHCATRLRLTIKDINKVNDNAIKSIKGIANTVNAAGQYQIIVGTEVAKLYDEFELLVDSKESVDVNTDSVSNESIINKIFSAISGIFAPLLPVLAGSGVLRGLIILGVQLDLIKENSSTYTILYSISMSVFYFLPVLLGFTAGRRFGASPYLSALIGACLLYPDFIELLGTQGNGAMTSLFGIPVILMNYNSTVVPIILSIWVFSYLYKFLDSHIHETLKLVVIPLISLIIMVPLTIIIIGPIGVYGGEGISYVVNWLIERSSVLTGVLIGGGWSVLVSFGIHWAVNPIMINNVLTNGYDYIVPFTFACNFAVIGTAIGVFIKSRNKEVRSFSATGVFTIALSAIIEPTLFGLLVRNKKLFLAQIIGGALGGAYLGLMKVVANSFVFGSVTTFPAFITSDSANFINAMIGLLISLIASAILGYIFTKKDDKLL